MQHSVDASVSQTASHRGQPSLSEALRPVLLAELGCRATETAPGPIGWHFLTSRPMALRRACCRLIEHSTALEPLAPPRAAQTAASSRELHTLQASVLQRCPRSDCAAVAAVDSPACGWPSSVQSTFDFGVERAAGYLRGVGLWLAVPKKKVGPFLCWLPSAHQPDRGSGPVQLLVRRKRSMSDPSYRVSARPLGEQKAVFHR